MRRGDAFTLIELLAALVLAGLLAVIAFASLAAPARAVRSEDQIGRVIAYDAAARRAGQSIAFDRRDATLSAGDSLPTLRLDSPFTIASVETAAGRVDEIAMSSTGRSEDYAVEITGGDAERWVLFLGMTGRATELDDEDDLRDIFDAFTPSE